MTFGDLHAAQDPSDAPLVMHSQLTTPNGLTLTAGDTPSGMEYSPGTNFSISLVGDDEEQLRGYWDRLADGATVTMPLEKAMWGREGGRAATAGRRAPPRRRLIPVLTGE